MERVSENIYEWTGHRELTEKDRKYLAELKKDTEGVFGEPIDEKEAMKLTKKEHLTGQDLQNHIDSKIAQGNIEMPNFKFITEAEAYLTLLRCEIAKLMPIKTKNQTPFFRSFEECKDYYVDQAKSETFNIEELKDFCLKKYGNEAKVSAVIGEIEIRMAETKKQRIIDAYKTAPTVFAEQLELVKKIESLQHGVSYLRKINANEKKQIENKEMER